MAVCCLVILLKKLNPKFCIESCGKIYWTQIFTKCRVHTNSPKDSIRIALLINFYLYMYTSGYALRGL